MSVRNNIPWRHLTEEERNIVRMWVALGLEYELTCFPNEPVWITPQELQRTLPDERSSLWCYRLKP